MMAKEAFGPYYERLKLAQFVECFRKYEELKAPVVQTIRDNERHEYERQTAEALRYITPEFGTAYNPIAARVNKVDWLKGEDRLTYTEREEMRNRQKQRNDQPWTLLARPNRRAQIHDKRSLRQWSDDTL